MCCVLLFYVHLICLDVHCNHGAWVRVIKLSRWVLNWEGTPTYLRVYLFQCCIWNTINEHKHIQNDRRIIPRVWQGNDSCYFMVTLLWWYNSILPKRISVFMHIYMLLDGLFLYPTPNKYNKNCLLAIQLVISCMCYDRNIFTVISLLG